MYFSSYTGRADLMLQVAAGSLAELNELVTQRMRGIEGIIEVDTLVELDVVKAHWAFPASLQHTSRANRDAAAGGGQ
jgi:DNA-binding Lrp family transcriptional regulator